jgi:REP element-mobilizing transposase RayT
MDDFSPGYYFITLYLHNRIKLFGDVINRKMVLNKCGNIVYHEWLQTGITSSNIRLDEFIIMPDHFHGIINIPETPQNNTAPCAEGFSSTQNIPDIIREFKNAVSWKINEYRNTPGSRVWQYRYYNQKIIDEQALNSIIQYIRKDPSHWINN